MKVKEITALNLSESETREVITPYAFKINKNMLGLSLASPKRRAFAICIDVMFIFLAAKLSAALISFVSAIALYKSTSKHYVPQLSDAKRRLLKVIASVILFVCTMLILATSIDYFSESDPDEQTMANIQGNNENLSLEQKQLIKQYLDSTKDKQKCNDLCQTKTLEELVNKIPILSELATSFEGKNLRMMLFGLLLTDESNQESDKNTQDVTTLISTPNEVTKANTDDEQYEYSILALGKGIIKDLGLGFGWAAIYFTLFSVLWKGQTPGKKLCKIRVVGLNGEYLNMWDAFGRYGGYGAGFATGLLGFLQIFWDPNRQAIQDKISATVVIKGDINNNILLRDIK